MQGIIFDIATRTGWKIEYIKSFPTATIKTWWHDAIHEKWSDRGKYEEPKNKETMLSEFERLKQEAGAEL